MVAILAVMANHLWGWPRGGFIGVDIFFVITGFLITGSFLRAAEQTGTAPFGKFYWTRVRRVLPAATVVLILTYLTAVLVFPPLRAHDAGVDALFAFAFMANWWFAADGTDFFAAAESASPLQHYWAVSVEEQFLFVWPLLIFVISLVLIRRPSRHTAHSREASTHNHRALPAGAVMAVIVAASLAWAWQESAASPNAAAFDTFARLWELGVGALLATAAGALARIPAAVKPLLSYSGLLLIGASLFLIGDDTVGFPAPWALLPVAGAAMVIAAGVGGEPKFQGLLRNRVSTYIGNISYSLYLVHWPVLVIVGSFMVDDAYFYLCVLTVTFGLAMAIHHLIENPLRNADLERVRETRRLIAEGLYHPERSSKIGVVTALALLTVGLCAYAARPDAYDKAGPPPVVEVAPEQVTPGSP
jgi:peptidoglycan/LPS O-acetylase OafA/YrhL